MAPRTAQDTDRVIDLTDNAAARRTGREPLIDIKEVAARLGVEVRHVRRLVHERRIPFVKWGHLLRFDPAEIDAWIDGRRVQPTASPVTSSAARSRAWVAVSRPSEPIG